MISYKVMLIALVLMTTTFESASNANAIESELSDGWQFSMDLNHFFIEINKSTDKNGINSNINDFIVKNDFNQKTATILPLSFSRIETFNKFSMSDYIDKEMKSRNLSNLSVKQYKIAGADGIVGRGYDIETRSWVDLAYFPAWPSDSKSDRAVLIILELGEGSYRLFDTIQVLKCPDRKEPLSQFLKSSEKISRTPAKLECKRRATARYLAIPPNARTYNDIEMADSAALNTIYKSRNLSCFNFR